MELFGAQSYNFAAMSPCGRYASPGKARSSQLLGFTFSQLPFKSGLLIDASEMILVKN